VDAVCDASFNEVANNLNNNIVMLNKTYNITNKSEKIEYTCFANVFFCNRPGIDLHWLHTNIFMLLRCYSCGFNFTTYTILHAEQYQSTKIESVEELSYSWTMLHSLKNYEQGEVRNACDNSVPSLAFQFAIQKFKDENIQNSNPAVLSTGATMVSNSEGTHRGGCLRIGCWGRCLDEVTGEWRS
jgi:hypothetical protein